MIKDCLTCKYRKRYFMDDPCNVCMTEEYNFYEKETKGIDNEKKQYGNKTNYKL